MTSSSIFSTVPTGAYSTLADLIRLRHGARDLKLQKQRQAFSLLAGPHQTRFRGRGVEFEEVRAYQPGDDIRTIDWRVTARTGKPHTKLFREERERPVLLLVDQGLSMFFGSRTCCKSVTAAHVAALLAWAALCGNDRVGGLVFNDSQHAEVRPKRKARNVLRLLNTIQTFNGQLTRDGEVNAAGLGDGLEELRRITRPGSNIFLITDLRSIDSRCEKYLYQLGRHNNVTVIQVIDPLEEELPPPGSYSVTNGRERARIFTGKSELRNQYRLRFQERNAALQRTLGGLGIPLLQISTSEAPLPFFRKLWGVK